MNIILTPRGDELLRSARDRHPNQSPAEIIEQALAERIEREQKAPPVERRRGRNEIRSWLDDLAQFSSKIPPMPGETFSREMIYQDHD